MDTIWTTWGEVFTSSLQGLWWGFIQFAPKLIIAIVFFIIGWVLGSIIAKALEQVFASLKVDKLFQSVGADNLLRRAGMNLNTGHFVGQLVKWFVIIVFLLPSLALVGLDSVGGFLQNDVLGYLPNIIVAAFVLIIATIIADALSKTATATGKSLNLSSSNMLGAVAKYAIWIFAFIIALEQLGIDSEYVKTFFAGLVQMVTLGAALAFGLGGKEAAGRFITKISDEMSNRG